MNGRNWSERSSPLSAIAAATNRFSDGRFLFPLDFSLLRDLERIVNLYSEVSNGAFELAMAKQKLNRSEVLRPLVNQARFCHPHRVPCTGCRFPSAAHERDF
jgi:HAMP domain-containing protein